ncbi:MAG: helix-turn-helix transcriptional regulator [Clostridia bacterium]|nr:helix-turn-helix transcriptional regulator [Clostridia bacterium]
MKFNQLISQRTKRLLKARHWTQYHLAQRGALSLSTLSTVLNCKTKTVTMETVLNICRGFDMRVADFFDTDIFDPENIADDD